VGLTDIMDTVIKITNKIRGGNHALIHRKFKNFLEEVHAEYGVLLLHSHVRWLSRGKCLKRFFQLPKEIKIFLMEVENSNSLLFIAKFNDIKFLSSLAFLTDITSFLNILNKCLQGRDQHVSKLVSHIIGFRNK